MKKITLLLFVAILAMNVNATYFVVPSGTGDGSSWANASGDIQGMINAANTVYSNSDPKTDQEVWVKAGTYSTSTAAIVMKVGVHVYGGFAGSETALNQRAKGLNAWDYTNTSILDGGGTKRCMEAGGGNYATVTIMDGFTLTNGNGQGAQGNNNGGGAYLRANLKLQNCIVTGNTTSGSGGGVNAYCGLISGCWIYSNTTTSGTIPAGGGIYTAPSAVGPAVIEDCLIERNPQGGIRFQSGAVTVNRCIIRNNSSTGAGAAIYANNPSSSVISNCLITNNTGNNSLYIFKTSVVNNTIANNEGNIYLASIVSPVFINNNIIVNNVSKGTTTPTSIGVVKDFPVDKVKNNAVYPEIDAQTWGGSTNTLLTTDVATALADVAFENPTSFIGATSDPTQLAEINAAKWNNSSNSKVVNFGDNSLVPAGIVTDILGNLRPINNVDAGAYEFQVYTSAKQVNSNFVCFATPNSVELRGVNAGDEVNVYTTTGAKLFSMKAAGSEVSVPVARGIYMVKVANKTNKVVVW